MSAVTPRKRRAVSRGLSYAEGSDGELDFDVASGESESDDEFTASPSKRSGNKSVRASARRSAAKRISSSVSSDIGDSAELSGSPRVRKRAGQALGPAKRVNNGTNGGTKEREVSNGNKEINTGKPTGNHTATLSNGGNSGEHQRDVSPSSSSSALRKLLQQTESYFDDTDGDQALFLDGYEGYFDQHKVREKISTTPFTRAPRLEYQEFTSHVHEATALNLEGKAFLRHMYIKMFAQWYFELSEGFGLLFYGVGSKRDLLMRFVGSQMEPHIPILVVNGYNPATTFKEILVSAVNILVKDETIKAEFPKNPLDLLAALLNYLEKTLDDKEPVKLVLMIHNLDGPSLRIDKVQTLLAKLASAKQIWVVASVDHINASSMFDAAKLAEYNFLWHDLTTYELYTVETSFEDPLSVGRDRSAVASKGVEYVLASLTEHAKRLYKLLLTLQVEKMSELLAKGDNNTVGSIRYGFETKIFYRKCNEELIVSNDVNFRTMLSEFVDHKMIVISKDKAGTETVYIPFTKDACESILKDML